MEELLSARATLILLAANIVISFAAFNSPRLADALMLHVEPILRRRQYHRMLTSGFLHGDPFHLLLNMITLYFLGPYLELIVGTAGFVLIYFASLIAGSAWSVMENLRNPDYRALGASGAISGVTTAFALFQPFAILLVFFVPMPAILFAVVYIAFSAFASGRLRDGIGHAAHLGGALMGVVLVCLIWPVALRNLWSDLVAMLGLG